MNKSLSQGPCSASFGSKALPRLLQFPAAALSEQCSLLGPFSGEKSSKGAGWSCLGERGYFRIFLFFSKAGSSVQSIEKGVETEALLFCVTSMELPGSGDVSGSVSGLGLKMGFSVVGGCCEGMLDACLVFGSPGCQGLSGLGDEVVGASSFGLNCSKVFVSLLLCCIELLLDSVGEFLCGRL